MTALSVAIPTYGREQVLIDSIEALLALDPPPGGAAGSLIQDARSRGPAPKRHLQDWASTGTAALDSA